MEDVREVTVICNQPTFSMFAMIHSAPADKRGFFVAHFVCIICAMCGSVQTRLGTGRNLLRGEQVKSALPGGDPKGC
jgi:hypothetical protein